MYRKQRGTIRWVKSGDAGTKFFHANATLKHRRNLITGLEDASGVMQTAHNAKTQILRDAYIERLGVTNYQAMVLDLHTLLGAPLDLSALEEPFTHDEIDQVVANLPTDKSPGPDGFNIDFVKKCWHIVKQDFYDLCDAFFLGEICLQSINGSIITLISKVDNPTQASQFRPTSLLNISVKIITKLLANRLQKEITSLVHQNQYGFIQSRTI